MTRNQNDVTKQFPELQIADKAFRATCGVFDTEIVSLDAAGKPVFKKVINRMMTNGESNILKQSKVNPVYCYIFDCLYLDGRPLINESLLKRREWLKDAVRHDTPYRISEVVEDGEGLFNAAREHGLEGIMAKVRDSKYLPGKRSGHWLKIKVRRTTEVVIIGYTKGKGDREKTFGALHIAERKNGDIIYRGKVGTGFDASMMKDIAKEIAKLSKVKKPITEKILDEKVSVWVEPELVIEVTYSKLTPDNMFREPVFVRMRPDL